MNAIEKIKNLINEKTKIAHYILICLCVALILLILWYFYRINILKSSNCTNSDALYKESEQSVMKMNSLETNYPDILTYTTLEDIYSEFTNTSDQQKFYLINYYVKSSYNSCCGGNYKNDYVSLCALENVIKQNVRFLDFEIYSVNNIPVVAASSQLNNNFLKETYNSIPLSAVLSTINNHAFASIQCSTDPLFINFRLMTVQACVLNAMNTIIKENITQTRLLSESQYNYVKCNNNNNNTLLYKVPIGNLLQKIIFIVDASTPGGCVFGNTDLASCINIVSTSKIDNTSFMCYKNTGIQSNTKKLIQNSATVTTVRYSDIVTNQVIHPETLQYHVQRKGIAVLLPDISPLVDKSTTSFNFGKDLGVQFIAIPMQTNNTNKYDSDNFFSDPTNKPGAFILKQPINCMNTPNPKLPTELSIDIVNSLNGSLQYNNNSITDVTSDVEYDY